MKDLRGSTHDLETAYLAELRQEHMGGRVRGAAVVIGTINALFAVLDAYAYPEHFVEFVGWRLALTACLAYSGLWLARRNPVAGEAVICVSTAVLLLYLVYATATPTSDYYAGLVLFIIGTTVLLPLRAVEVAAFSVPATVAFMVSPWVLQGLGTAGSGFDGRAVQLFAIHCCFLVGASLVAIASAYMLDRHRFNDFMQRRVLEQARDELRELDRAKSRFSANVHHELRTPLTLILSPLEALIGGEFGPVDPTHRPYLESMVSNARRLLRLISDLLDVSKIESHQLRLRRRPLQVARLIEDLVATAAPLARVKNVQVTLRDVDRLPEIEADLGALEKVFLNLLGNALKFTRHGGRIEIIGVSGESGVTIAVVDDGIGIPIDQLEQVFDRFAQVDGSATRHHEGTGIGLSLAKELVELHGGRIRAMSEGPGTGARFEVHLPLGSGRAEPEKPAEESIETGVGSLAGALQAAARSGGDDTLRPEPGFGEADMRPDSVGSPAAERATTGVPSPRPKLLVVEDNGDMRRFLAAILANDYSVRTAANGREGLERALEVRPDLVVSDVMMPEMSGTDLCRALEDNPRTRGTPVLLLTAKSDREMKVEGLELGARDYVTKPFHPAELLARVRSIVQIEILQRKLAQRNAVLESTIYELKQTEVQLVQAERLAAVGELAAGIAHEVNNPVNFSINSLQALRARVDDVGSIVALVSGIDPSAPDSLASAAKELAALDDRVAFTELMPELLELVGIATDGLDRTHRLVKDLQNFARPGNTQHEPVDVRDALSSTVRLVRAGALESGVEIVSDLERPVPVIESSVSVLNQVFLNLLKNATEALEGRRGGTIRVEAHTESHEDGQDVVVTIADDGPGIDPAVRGQLFDPFVSTKPAGRGAGLGLSVCRRILTDLGGSIDCVERDGPGAVFEVRLPVQGGHDGDAP